jgi:hypothetical protein
MKQIKTIEKKISVLENRIIKFKNDSDLDDKLVKSAVKRIKAEIKILKWVINK